MSRTFHTIIQKIAAASRFDGTAQVGPYDGDHLAGKTSVPDYVRGFFNSGTQAQTVGGLFDFLIDPCDGTRYVFADFTAQLGDTPVDVDGDRWKLYLIDFAGTAQLWQHGSGTSVNISGDEYKLQMSANRTLKLTTTTGATQAMVAHISIGAR